MYCWKLLTIPKIQNAFHSVEKCIKGKGNKYFRRRNWFGTDYSGSGSNLHWINESSFYRICSISSWFLAQNNTKALLKKSIQFITLIASMIAVLYWKLLHRLHQVFLRRTLNKCVTSLWDQTLFFSHRYGIPIRWIRCYSIEVC